VAVPLATRNLVAVPKLTVTEVAGEVVPQPSTASMSTTDVMFFEGGSVDIKVEAENIPDGTLVGVRITGFGAVITPAEQALAGGETTFSTVVPSGLGSVQASSEYTP
jgi:hypothetical protein